MEGGGVVTTFFYKKKLVQSKDELNAMEKVNEAFSEKVRIYLVLRRSKSWVEPYKLCLCNTIMVSFNSFLYSEALINNGQDFLDTQ